MLKKQQRVTSNKDFQFIYRRGRHNSSAFFSINYINNIYGQTRVGVVISKKVARKAVERNHLKRQLRSIIQKHYQQILPGADILLSARGNILDLDFEKLTKELLLLLEKSNLIKK